MLKISPSDVFKADLICAVDINVHHATFSRNMIKGQQPL